MVNSVAVERQAISRRGERESSGGGKKERKGRKKERMDCFVRFRDERVKAKGKRGRGPDAPRGACATCVFPRRLFHRFNRRVPSFPLPLVPLRGRRYCSCSPSVSWRDPERKWERFVSKGRKSGGAQTRSPRLSLRHSAGTIPTNETNAFVSNPWESVSPVISGRDRARGGAGEGALAHRPT